jgi:hypothetical protein
MRTHTEKLITPLFVQPPRHPVGYETAPECSTALALPELTPAVPVAWPVEASAEEEWLREEKVRLEAYLTRQLDLLYQQREEIAQMRSDAEADFLRRELALNRQEKTAAHREQALVLREASLEVRSNQQTEAVEEVLQLSKLQENLQRDLDTQREILEQLHLEVNQVRDRARVIKKDYDGLRKAVRKVRAEQLDLQGRRQEWERRERALQQAEEALQRRITENEELEYRLEGEMVRREQIGTGGKAYLR